MAKPDTTAAIDVLRDLGEPAPLPTDEQPSQSTFNPYVGIAQEAFAEDAIKVLLAPVDHNDVEIRPDGLIYLPEIKYRRILNRAFGPGAWSLPPIEITVSTDDNMLYYKGALFVHGRFVSEAIGEQQYYPENDRMSYGTAAESAKSNCLMRCCKDLGIASELWDPGFVRAWVSANAVEVWCTNVSRDQSSRGRKRRLWRKASDPVIDQFPWREDADPSEPVSREVEPPSRTRGEQKAWAGDLRQPPAVTRPVSGQPNRAGNPPAVVSFRQARRFRAIARDNEWTSEEIDRLLADAGYQSAEEILRRDYDRLCDALDDQASHIAVREALSAPSTNAASTPRAMRRAAETTGTRSKGV